MTDRCYKVYLRSVPGPYEQYDGFVRVSAEDEAEAVELAIRQLRRTTFPDRSAAMWRVERVVGEFAATPRAG